MYVVVDFFTTWNDLWFKIIHLLVAVFSSFTTPKQSYVMKKYFDFVKLYEQCCWEES